MLAYPNHKDRASDGGAAGKGVIRVFLDAEDVLDFDCPQLRRLFNITVVLNEYMQHLSRLFKAGATNRDTREDLRDRDVIQYAHDLFLLIVAYRDAQGADTSAYTADVRLLVRLATAMLVIVGDAMRTVTSMLYDCELELHGIQGSLDSYMAWIYSRRDNSVLQDEYNYWDHLARTAEGTATKHTIEDASAKRKRARDLAEPEQEIKRQKREDGCSNMICVAPRPPEANTSKRTELSPWGEEEGCSNIILRPAFKAKTTPTLTREATKDEVSKWQETWKDFLSACEAEVGVISAEIAKELYDQFVEPMTPLAEQFEEQNANIDRRQRALGGLLSKLAKAPEEKKPELQGEIDDLLALTNLPTTKMLGFATYDEAASAIQVFRATGDMIDEIQLFGAQTRLGYVANITSEGKICAASGIYAV
ncbi:hypothetical protein GQ53DRAFT_45779 [Thozetella sp. PMI_491]|nr:hypothetical protein GQ53DRAFT_45779 [Thozetella sp. PMI_491]